MSFARKCSLLNTAVLALLFALLVPAGIANASYRENELIDNYTFLQYSSMTSSEIHSFFISKGGWLGQSHTFTETCSGTYEKTHYAHCGKKEYPWAIIADAGIAYGLNPRAIIATIQKEEGLVTDPSPDQSQIDFAMGYACPDSGGCGAVSGFFNQVDFGTWQLRMNYARASGDNNWYNSTTSYACPSKPASNPWYYSMGLYPNNNVTFSDGHNVKYAAFRLFNASTASLYCYTPHAYNNPNGINGLPKFGTTGQYYTGSYNFVKDYELWWGSTIYDTGKDQPIVGDWNGSDKITPAIRRATTFYFDNNGDGAADASYSWGRATDKVIAGDFNSDGKTDLGLKRGSTYYLDYSTASGSPDGHADKSIMWGRTSDQILAGNWDGTSNAGHATDEIGLKRGNEYFLDFNNDGHPDKQIKWGRATDQAFVGKWSGTRSGIGLKRGKEYFLDFNNDGHPDKHFTWGRPTDQILAGNWYASLDNKTDLGLKRGNEYFLDLNNDYISNQHLSWGRASDRCIVGDWNSDGKDTLGLKRDSVYYFDNNYTPSADTSLLYTY